MSTVMKLCKKRLGVFYPGRFHFSIDVKIKVEAGASTGKEQYDTDKTKLKFGPAVISPTPYPSPTSWERGTNLTLVGFIKYQR